VNTGDECSPNNYFTSSSCQPRVNYIHNCVNYFDTTTDLEADPACTACVDGRNLALNKTWAMVSDVNTTYYGYECVGGTSSIDNCKWGMKYNSTDSITVTTADYCYACKQGSFPDASSRSVDTAPSVMPVMFTSCAGSNSSGVENCAYMGVDNSGAQVCYACESGYVLDDAGTACVAYATDSTCMQVDSTGTYCKKCWWPYWYFNTKCTGSNILKVSIVSLLLIYLGFN